MRISEYNEDEHNISTGKIKTRQMMLNKIATSLHNSYENIPLSSYKTALLHNMWYSTLLHTSPMKDENVTIETSSLYYP